jgi:hypothetical protein
MIWDADPPTPAQAAPRLVQGHPLPPPPPVNPAYRGDREGGPRRKLTLRQRFAHWAYYTAYGHSLWYRDEMIKREWLDKGVERGRAKPRVGTIFDLYLARTDEYDPTRVAMQQAAGVQASVAGGGDNPQWRWWVVMNEMGHESCLGPLDTLPLAVVLIDYLKLLPRDVRDKVHADDFDVFLSCARALDVLDHSVGAPVKAQKGESYADALVRQVLDRLKQAQAQAGQPDF